MLTKASFCKGRLAIPVQSSSFKSGAAQEDNTVLIEEVRRYYLIYDESFFCTYSYVHDYCLVFESANRNRSQAQSEGSNSNGEAE